MSRMEVKMALVSLRAAIREGKENLVSEVTGISVERLKELADYKPATLTEEIILKTHLIK